MILEFKEASKHAYISLTMYTMNFGSEMVQALQVYGKNMFCSMSKDKIEEEEIFEVVHCPFEG